MSKYKKNVDWEAMRPDWVAGIKPVLQLSKEFDVSRAAIHKHWEAEGVERDLAAKIKAKADALVTRALVTQSVTHQPTVTDTEIINANATQQSTIILNERSDVTRARAIAFNLFNELEDQVLNKELYEQMGELLLNPDEKGTDKLNELYRKVTSFSGRTDNLKKLSDSLKTLIELERKVYKIDDIQAEEDKNKRVNVTVNFV